MGPGSSMNRHEFIDWLEDVRVGTRRLISMVPDEAFEYRATDEAPTVEQLMRAFASLEDQFTRGVCAGDWSDPGSPSDARREIARAYAEDTDDFEFAEEMSESMYTADEILDHLDRIHQESLDIIAELSDEEFQARKVQVPWGEEATIQRLMIGMVEREIHHRTELYLALQQYGLPMSLLILWGP
jgi:hypothetical protein